MLVVINNRDLLTWPKAMAEKLPPRGPYGSVARQRIHVQTTA